MGLFTYVVGLSYLAYLGLLTLIGYVLPPYEIQSAFEPMWLAAILILLFLAYRKFKNTPFPINRNLILKNIDVILVFLAILAIRFFVKVLTLMLIE